MDNENASKINWLGAVSLALSALILLILLGVLIVLILAVNHSSDTGNMFSFWSYFYGTFTHFYGFPLCALPLGILNIIVAIFARRRGSARQIKVAGRGITIGILGILTSFCLTFYFILLGITGD